MSMLGAIFGNTEPVEKKPMTEFERRCWNKFHSTEYPHITMYIRLRPHDPMVNGDTYDFTHSCLTPDEIIEAAEAHHQLVAICMRRYMTFKEQWPQPFGAVNHPIEIAPPEVMARYTRVVNEPELDRALKEAPYIPSFMRL